MQLYPQVDTFLEGMLPPNGFLQISTPLIATYDHWHSMESFVKFAIASKVVFFRALLSCSYSSGV